MLKRGPPHAGCRERTTHSPSLSLSLSLSLLTLDRTDVYSPLLRLFPTQFRAKIDFSRKKETHLLCSHRHITVIAGPTCLIAHLLAPPDRAASQGWTPGEFLCTCTPRCVGANNAKQTHTEKVSAIRNPEKGSFGTEYSTSPLGMGLGPTDRARNQPFFGGVPHPPDPTDRANRPSQPTSEQRAEHHHVQVVALSMY